MSGVFAGFGRRTAAEASAAAAPPSPTTTSASFGMNLFSTISHATARLAAFPAMGNNTTKTTHAAVIEQELLPLMVRLQKETRGRRYREIQAALQDAVLALSTFQSEEWPPSSTRPPTTTLTMRSVAQQQVGGEDEPRQHQPAATDPAMELPLAAPEDDDVSVMTADTMQTESTQQTAAEAAMAADVQQVLATISNEEDDDNQGNHAQQQATMVDDAAIKNTGRDFTKQEGVASMAASSRQPNGTASNNSGSAPSSTAVYISPAAASSGVIILSSDDPQTREPVHEAIEVTLEALIATLAHPAKVVKVLELAFEAIDVIVAKRYFSGRAGGQDDWSGSGSTALSASTATSTTLSGLTAATTTTTNAAGAAVTSPTATSTYTAASAAGRPAGASLLHRLLESIAKCSESGEDAVHIALIKTLQTIMTSPKCGIHEASMLLALRATFHVYLVSKSNHVQAQAKSTLLDMLRLVFSRMEAYDAVAKHNNLGNNTNISTIHEDPPTLSMDGGTSDRGRATAIAAATFASQYHADSFALLRALCKLSSKELPADQQEEPDRKTIFINTQVPTDPLALRSKLLALELILAAMDWAGPAILHGERFLFLLQNYLCVSLLKNCVSNQTQVAFLSQKIFLVLVYKFKRHLKQEIEVFMSNIFLRVLESPNSSFKQKALVLESLRSLCRDPVLLTQVFLNYDCDFDAMNLYKDMVHMLTKLCGKAASLSPGAAVSKKDAEQELELSSAGMEVLVTILKAFLMAMNLPGGEEDSACDSAGARIRGMLQLDVGLAVSQPAITRHPSSASLSEMDSASNHSSVPNLVRSSDRTTPATPTAASTSAVGNGEFASTVEGHSATAGGDTPDGPATPGTGTSNAAGKIVDAFEMKRIQEQNFEIGAVKFTLSLKSGLKFFIDNGFVECDARQIALFFLANKDKLDKTQVGEALGREVDASFVKGDDVDPDRGGPGFWVRILHHYVDAQDFTGIMFDEAIRLFLSGFRLPGEAQKIDRIMEKFAERFTTQNPDIFPSADTAFILAFSVIMLNTDLHNPSIKPERRMTLESFIRNNRGIGENGTDLPDEFLKGIFDRIKERPFSLKEDDAARERVGTQKQAFDPSAFFDGATFFGTNAEDRKRDKFKKERDEMMAVTEQLIRRRPERVRLANGSTTQLTDSIPPVDVVKPMFDVTWGPMIGILSQVLECSDDERLVAVCLNGFVYAVRVAAHSSMSLARDTFVSSLAKFTFLGSIKEMKRKNVESIRTLLSIAVIDGEYLGESWGPVLQCISQLARLRLSASGLDSDESFLVNEKGKKDRTIGSSVRGDYLKDGLFRQPPSKGDIAKEAEESNGRVVLEAVQEVLIDKVFSSTTKLSAKSLAHFIEELISVSSSEISGTSKRGITGVDSSDSIRLSGSSHGDGPSIFSLQRLVEVADYNMDIRPRLVWAPIWERMADHFAKLACQDNMMVSVFALDGLKQLSLKFLEKPELSEFHFQRIFLKPFLDVIEDKRSKEEINELVLRCIDNIIRTKSHNLRSGWKIVFSILNCAAVDPHPKIEFLGLAILQRLLDDHLDQLCSSPESKKSAVDSVERTAIEKRMRNANADDFVGLCKASLAFVQTDEADSSRPVGSSMRALCHTAIYSDLIASNQVLPPVSGAQHNESKCIGYTYKDLSDVEALEMVLWRPLLEGLAAGVRSTAKTSASGVGCLIQRASVLALRAILLRHGHLFSVSQLAAILEQTLLPAIQAAAESDRYPVVAITSESPAVSSIDFLADPLPLPPPPDDECLVQFAQLHRVQRRSLGDAELMLEASFTDLKHGGDGDLRRAHLLSKKATQPESASHEQPFPDSWLATTARSAIGLLTDIICVIVAPLGHTGRARVWPCLSGQYKLWCVGRQNSGISSLQSWSPCEALVRISCMELGRLHQLLTESVADAAADRNQWSLFVSSLLSEMLKESVSIEDRTRKRLRRSKIKAIPKRKEINGDSSTLVTTPFGQGQVLGYRTDQYGSSLRSVKVRITLLRFGARLYQPILKEMDDHGSRRQSSADEAIESSDTDSYWEEAVPILKVCCVAAHCIHQALMDIREYIPLEIDGVLPGLLDNLNASRRTAAGAVGDKIVSTAFQASLLECWGDGMMNDEVHQSSARLSLLHGSAMFFMTQEAGATRAVIQILSMVYLQTNEKLTGEVSSSMVEVHLLEVIRESLGKFLVSEEKDVHLVDPNMWRTASESGSKVALYCISFAPVVADILKIIRSVRRDQFEKHKDFFFPSVCALIRSHSDEIRQLVHDVLALQVAPILGVPMD